MTCNTLWRHRCNTNRVTFLYDERGCRRSSRILAQLIQQVVQESRQSVYPYMILLPHKWCRQCVVSGPSLDINSSRIDRIESDFRWYRIEDTCVESIVRRTSFTYNTISRTFSDPLIPILRTFQLLIWSLHHGHFRLHIWTFGQSILHCVGYAPRLNPANSLRPHGSR